MTTAGAHRFLSFLLLVGLLLMPDPTSPANATQTIAATTLTDFTPNSPGFGWYVQNDNVMGGKSEGGFVVATGELLFSGSTNTNGGGFSSIRTQSIQMDLSRYTGISLRVKGDGRRYTWHLRTNAEWRGRPISYWADFGTEAGQWHDVTIPFTRFHPRFRGLKLDGPKLDTKEITEMGLYIYDKLDGPFQIYLSGVGVFTDNEYNGPGGYSSIGSSTD